VWIGPGFSRVAQARVAGSRGGHFRQWLEVVALKFGRYAR
jgi:hypothetical protein